jgi:hypothetical protein
LETLNSVIENQDADANFQLAFGDILTCHMRHAFKFIECGKTLGEAAVDN